jgi:hypothetical protein
MGWQMGTFGSHFLVDMKNQKSMWALEEAESSDFKTGKISELGIP